MRVTGERFVEVTAFPVPATAGGFGSTLSAVPAPAAFETRRVTLNDCPIVMLAGGCTCQVEVSVARWRIVAEEEVLIGQSGLGSGLPAAPAVVRSVLLVTASAA